MDRGFLSTEQTLLPVILFIKSIIIIITKSVAWYLNINYTCNRSLQFQIVNTQQKQIMKDQLKLTGIIIAAEEGGYTGYFAEFPEALAEGETKEEVKQNMMESLALIFDCRRSEATVDNEQESFDFNLELA